MNDEKARLEFSARLEMVLDDLGYPAHGRYTKVANDFGLTYQATKKWLKGVAMPDRHRMQEVANFYGVNYQWLATGEGPRNDPGAEGNAAQRLQDALKGLENEDKIAAVEKLLETLDRAEAIKIVTHYLNHLTSD